jgi:hypothetical protein
MRQIAKLVSLLKDRQSVASLTEEILRESSSAYGAQRAKADDLNRIPSNKTST